MQTTLQVALIAFGYVSIGSFFGAFIANLLLLGATIRGDGAKQKSSKVTIWNFGNPLTPIKYYEERVWPIWRIRDRCLKVFAVTIGLDVILAVVAAIEGIKFQ